MRWLAALLLMLLAVPAQADEARPLYVEGHADAAGAITLTWRIPPVFPAASAPDMVLPADCAGNGPSREWSDGLGHWREASWTCAEPLAGRSFAIHYPSGNPNLSTIYRSVAPSGASAIAMVLPGKADLAFPADGADAAQDSGMGDYLKLGIEHIWLGFDHLLFVACLVWIAGSGRRILATVTGFTLGHSVTLAAAALDLVTVPVRTIEVLIALSIVLLAVELARGRSDTITWRHPVAVSSAFGLLHGFGFAAVLRQIGLPQEGLLGALLAFNVGIEIGQLLFVIALVAATAALAFAGKAIHARLDSRFPAQAIDAAPRLIIAYFVGITATYWMLERAA